MHESRGLGDVYKRQDGNRVMVKLRGTCASCAKSQITLKHYVETKLKELVSQDLVVEEV